MSTCDNSKKHFETQFSSLSSFVIKLTSYLSMKEIFDLLNQVNTDIYDFL